MCYVSGLLRSEGELQNSVTPPSSPSQILKETDNQWLNSEVCLLFSVWSKMLWILTWKCCGVVLRLGSSVSDLQLLAIREQHVMKCYTGLWLVMWWTAFMKSATYFLKFWPTHHVSNCLSINISQLICCKVHNPS